MENGENETVYQVDRLLYLFLILDYEYKDFRDTNWKQTASLQSSKIQCNYNNSLNLITINQRLILVTIKD